MRSFQKVTHSADDAPEGLDRQILTVAGSAAVLHLVGAFFVASLARSGGDVPWLALLVVSITGAAAAATAFIRLRDRDPARIKALSAVLAAVNSGDLTAATSSQHRDGLGDVERGVDQMVARMTQIVGTLQEGLERFHTGRQSVAQVHKDMLDSAELTAGQAYDAGVSAEQVSDSINIVASSTEELVATVKEIARHATFAADIAVTAAAQGEVADKGVHELSTALEQVQSIANVIGSIAGQTHLLALNAMIEAARAGDAGLGFEVVAAEVKELSRATAEATQQVRSIVVGIQEGSERASEAITQITGTMALICESTSSIASTVTQQTATTREIGRVSIIAAQGAADISGRVAAVHDRARDVAYAGASNDATKAKEFEILETAFRRTIDGMNVGGYVAGIATDEEVAIDQEALNREGTTTTDGVTTVLDTVLGTGLNQFAFTGSWLHGSGYDTDPGGDAYSSIPGDEVRMSFAGRRLRFHGCKDKQQGMAEVWIDEQPRELIDFYAPDRLHQLLWESPELPPGEHTFHLVVSSKKNADSRYFWNSVAKVEIVH